MLTSDASIWDKFLKGDDAAFTYIYDNHIHSLFSYGLQFSSERELIKDAIQDLFVKLYLNKESLSSTTNIKFYLFRSLRNTLYNTFRQNINMGNIEDLEDKIIERDTPLHNLLQQEKESLTKDELNKIFNLLSTRQREVMFYRFIEEFSFEEIETLMGINYQSIQNLIQRSIKKVRDNMALDHL